VLWTLLPVVLSTALAAGCGGGGDGSSSAVAQGVPANSLGPVVRCLRRSVHAARVSTAIKKLDQIARRATMGAAMVRFDVSTVAPKGLNVATIVLERSDAIARATESHYRGVYKALGGDPRALLSRTANAVVAFGSRPSGSERAAIGHCLRPA
jgi:hypothetical protein